jgi:hypothetical protein
VRIQLMEIGKAQLRSEHPLAHVTDLVLHLAVGEGTPPPNVVNCPKPTSSSRIRSTFGAPSKPSQGPASA